MQKIWLTIILMTLLAAACAPLAADGGEPDTAQAETVLPTAEDSAALLQSSDDYPPAGAESQFRTDFSKHTIPYSEVLSGGPPKDGIPAIDAPEYVTIEEADAWLADAEAVVVVEVEGVVRAYPVQILMWHEIINDTLGGRGLSVTYCPLCNTAIAFEREFEGQLLDFGTTGRLRFSNLIMYDRQTETWWQQATGEGIAGEFAGSELTAIPAFLIAWDQFKAVFPDGDVLSRRTGFQRNYGVNPYVGYDTAFNDPFLYQGPQTPDALPPMARVLTIDREDETVAFPYSALETEGVINETVGGLPVVVFWQAGTASALDRAAVGEGKDVGNATAYAREVGGETLTFTAEGDTFRDAETGSTWNNLGQALSGELAGTALEPVVSINHFWFSWAAFRPQTRIAGQADAISSDAGANKGRLPENTTPVDLAQDFKLTLYQGADLFSGEDIFFSELFTDGKPVVAMFFAGLCPFCRADLPLLQEAYDQAAGDIEMIVIDIGPYTNLGSIEDGKVMLADLDISMPAGSLQEPMALSVYRVLGTPAFLFFDARGELIRSWVGSVKAEQLNDYIAEIS
jgi:thiol-disulfide isomerase/thioredoxin